METAKVEAKLKVPDPQQVFTHVDKDTGQAAPSSSRP
jgi:hypothetical protein